MESPDRLGETTQPAERIQQTWAQRWSNKDQSEGLSLTATGWLLVKAKEAWKLIQLPELPACRTQMTNFQSSPASKNKKGNARAQKWYKQL